MLIHIKCNKVIFINRFGYNAATGEIVIKKLNASLDMMLKWSSAIQWYRPTEIENMPRRRQIMTMEPRWTSLADRKKPRQNRDPGDIKVKKEP